MTKMLKNSILSLSVSTLLSPIVAFRFIDKYSARKLLIPTDLTTQKAKNKLLFLEIPSAWIFGKIDLITLKTNKHRSEPTQWSH